MKWYDILIEEEFINYFENDPDIDRDISDQNSMFCKFSRTVEGLMIAEILKDRPALEMYLDADVQRAYLFFAESDEEGKNFVQIAASIRELSTSGWYDIPLEHLSAAQIAFLIIYPFASRMGGSFELAFAKSGELKKYLKSLKEKRSVNSV